MAKMTDTVQKMTHTPNEERLKQLKHLFPECLTEGEVDLHKLEKLLNINGGGMSRHFRQR